MGFLRLLAFSISLVIASGAAEGSAPVQKSRKAPPSIHTDLVPGTEVVGGQELRFTVTVKGPGTKVSLQLLNPPPGLVFDPVHGAQGKGESSARWLVPDTASGRYALVFEARDSLQRRRTLEVPVTVLSEGNTAVRNGDVTGDGLLDIVAGAHLADQGGTGDAGRIYVFAGGGLSGSVAPTATLSASAPAASDRLGEAGGQGIQLADVTGDGILDVVAGATRANVGGVGDTGAIYVWAGGAGLSGSVTPTALLRVPGAVSADQLGQGIGLGIQLADVTGDGVVDIVAQALAANVGGVSDTGAIYVWAGGAGLAGTLSPSATLTVPGAATSDSLCGATGQGVRLGDVTNDGVLDIVSAAPSVDTGVFSVDLGKVYVWAGGAGLSGSVSPSATLSVPGAVSGDQLGVVSGGPGILLVELTNDGVLDVLAGASSADIGGTANTGALYVFAGGAGLSGAVTPTATMSVPGAVAGDQLGTCTGQALQVAELTGDGVLDVVAGATFADVGGVSDTGAIYVWAGSAGLAGSVSPTASLTVPGAAIGDQLGTGTGQSIQLVDVTGDGSVDVVASAINADAGAFVVDSGAIFVWGGGAGLLGSVSPLATLRGIQPFDRLGDAASQGVQLADVTADGVADIVAGASNADTGLVLDTGKVLVWKGGPALSGLAAADAILAAPGALAGDQLASAFGQGVHLADVTSDGTLDVVVGASNADLGVVDAGEILVWAGGPGLVATTTPAALATLSVPGAAAGDKLGFVFEGLGIQLADLTGDGRLDIVSGSLSTNGSRGALYVWKGGASLAGALSPAATLSVPGATALDRLGEAGGQGVQFADVNGDGVLDLVAAAEFANIALVSDSGALFVWLGGGGITGPTPPSATLSVPGAAVMDRLGS